MDADTKVDQDASDLATANQTMHAALRLVADLRHALGDDGKRMQPELLEYARQLVSERDRLRAELASHTYASKQSANCAECGNHKHTPLRIDAMGGYVCLTCIDRRLCGLLGEFGYPDATAWLTDEQIFEIRDDHLPSQGASFDCLAFAKAILVAVARKADVEARQLVKDAARWLPIETAPKDSSYFLAANEHGVWVAHWKEFADSGYKFDRPLRSVMLNHRHITPESAQHLPPTHWMPLPQPPGAPA